MIYLDKAYECGMAFRDITLACDICGLEGYETTNAHESRRHAKQDGWIRKWSKNKKEYQDICKECQGK